MATCIGVEAIRSATAPRSQCRGKEVRLGPAALQHRELSRSEGAREDTEGAEWRPGSPVKKVVKEEEE